MSAPLHTEKTIFLEAAEIASPTERVAFLEASAECYPRIRRRHDGRTTDSVSVAVEGANGKGHFLQLDYGRHAGRLTTSSCRTGRIVQV